MSPSTRSSKHANNSFSHPLRLAATLTLLAPYLALAATPTTFTGQHYRGTGDAEYLQHLDTAARMFTPDPQYQNLSMLYIPLWNGLVEGPTWDAWWVQNSYGTTYASLPLLQEPFLTFLQNSQDLWFDQMGDGKRQGEQGWVAPDGSLCDAAKPGWIYYKQGDGKIHLHDWGMEFTAAGVVMQAELLLISRDKPAVEKYLPKLERCINFIESRRDPKNNLFLAGPAANLLAPSYAGYLKPDGTYDKAYLTGLSITYIAALDRMIELQKFINHPDTAADYQRRRDTAHQALPQLTTPEGYFIRSLDPDGTKHGVHPSSNPQSEIRNPQSKHAYFESSPNHDAIAFRITDDPQSHKIYNKIASIPELRRHAFVIPNHPSYDDMYEPAQGLWAHGTWVNGGHWSTCEARMMLAYARLGKFDDQKASMRQLMKFADTFRMDNPLVDFGNAPYQPNQPINLCYDTLGPAAALRRGLFEYLYKHDRLILIPHIPDTLTELHQLDPVRFGAKKIYLSVQGTGPITRVLLNDQDLPPSPEIALPYDTLPDDAHVTILRGNDTAAATTNPTARTQRLRDTTPLPNDLLPLQPRLDTIRRLAKSLDPNTYEAAHARLIDDAVTATVERSRLQSAGKLPPLPPASQKAADQSYPDTVTKLLEGLEKTLTSYQSSPDPAKRNLHRLWQQ
jgi:hypothetical protein